MVHQFAELLLLVSLHNADIGIGVLFQAQDSFTTALHFAALNGNIECVRVLVLHGADKEARDIVRDLISATYFILACE
jgi:ankyrin repeat protein